MLDELAVSNLGIIAEAHLEPGDGLVVVTGETGAGKTLLLGALRLLRGTTARTDIVGPAADEARVDGRFVVAGEEVSIGRRVGGSRSRAYLNGTMAPARTIEEHMRDVIEIVGQHDQLSLTRTAELRRLIDRRLPDPEVAMLYEAAWHRLEAAERLKMQLGGDRRALQRELDLVAFQAEEIAAAGFGPGEDESLLAAAGRLRHAEELIERLGHARSASEDAGTGLGDAIAEIRVAAELDTSIAAMRDEAETLAADLADLSSRIRVASEQIDVDPETLAVVESRLALLGDLRRKYGASLDEILTFGIEAAERRDELAGLLESADSLDQEVAEARAAAVAAGALLRAARQEAASAVSGDAVAHLVELGFEDPLVELLVVEADVSASGADAVELMFASDRRLQPGPVGRVASGGELSRLVLSLRLAAGAGEAAVVAFDEIDAGVGGATAFALGKKLAALASERQVLVVTHLPQVAAFADRHYVVRRTGASAVVEIIDDDARLEELARMLSGLPDSDLGREHAGELRELALEARG